MSLGIAKQYKISVTFLENRKAVTLDILDSATRFSCVWRQVLPVTLCGRSQVTVQVDFYANHKQSQKTLRI